MQGHSQQNTPPYAFHATRNQQTQREARQPAQGFLAPPNEYAQPPRSPRGLQPPAQGFQDASLQKPEFSPRYPHFRSSQFADSHSPTPGSDRFQSQIPPTIPKHVEESHTPAHISPASILASMKYGSAQGSNVGASHFRKSMDIYGQRSSLQTSQEIHHPDPHLDQNYQHHYHQQHQQQPKGFLLSPSDSPNTRFSQIPRMSPSVEPQENSQSPLFKPKMIDEVPIPTERKIGEYQTFTPKSAPQIDMQSHSVEDSLPKDKMQMRPFISEHESKSNGEHKVEVSVKPSYVSMLSRPLPRIETPQYSSEEQSSLESQPNSKGRNTPRRVVQPAVEEKKMKPAQRYMDYRMSVDTSRIHSDESRSSNQMNAILSPRMSLQVGSAFTSKNTQPASKSKEDSYMSRQISNTTEPVFLAELQSQMSESRINTQGEAPNQDTKSNTSEQGQSRRYSAEAASSESASASDSTPTNTKIVSGNKTSDSKAPTLREQLARPDFRLSMDVSRPKAYKEGLPTRPKMTGTDQSPSSSQFDLKHSPTQSQTSVGSIPNMASSVPSKGDRALDEKKTQIEAHQGITEQSTRGETRQRPNQHARPSAIEMLQPDAKELPILVEKSLVVIGVEIGRGSFGVVRKCTVDGILVAVKIVRNDFSLEAGEALAFLKSEIEILSTVTDHPNIIKYVGHQYLEREYRLFLEYIPFSLREIIKKQRRNKRHFTSAQLKVFFGCIADAVRYLHNLPLPIAHRDLKSSNVLVDISDSGVVQKVKLCDFGVAKACHPTRVNRITSIVGTPGFIAPEIKGGRARNKVNQQADAYSFGVFMIEVMTLDLEITDKDQGSFESALQKIGAPLEILRALAERCIQPNPENRPSFAQICETLSHFQ